MISALNTRQFQEGSPPDPHQGALPSRPLPGSSPLGTFPRLTINPGTAPACND